MHGDEIFNGIKPGITVRLFRAIAELTRLAQAILQVTRAADRIIHRNAGFMDAVIRLKDRDDEVLARLRRELPDLFPPDTP